MVSASIRSNFDEWMENRYSFRFHLDFSKLEEINLKRITFSIRFQPTLKLRRYFINASIKTGIAGILNRTAIKIRGISRKLNIKNY